MGIFKKTEKETIYDDYDDESYRDEELLEEAEKEKTANKMFNILNIYETFDKKNKKKHEDRKSGELDEKTKEKQSRKKGGRACEDKGKRYPADSGIVPVHGRNLRGLRRRSCESTRSVPG